MYNHDWDKLLLTLNSAISQKNIDFEIVICDDGSKNNFEKELKAYFYTKNFDDYKLVMNPVNGGTVKNVISGFTASSGEYVKDISPGDYFYDDSVMSKFDAVIKESDADIYFGNAVFYYDECNGVNKNRVLFPEKHNPIDYKPYIKNDKNRIRFNYLVKHDYVLGAVFITKRELQLKYLKKIENYVKYAEDCSFIWMIAAGCTIKYVDIPFIWYEYGSGISTQGSDRWLKIIYEDNRNVYKLMLDSGDIKKWVYNISYSNNKFVKITLRLFVFGVMKKIKNIFKEKQNNLMKKDF